MKIKTEIKQTQVPLIAEGMYDAQIVSVAQTAKTVKDGDKPELDIEFSLEDQAENIKKRYLASLSGRSSLKRDIETVMGRNLNRHELAEFDTDILVDSRCQVLVVHRSENGGRLKARISTVLGAPVEAAKEASNPVASPPDDSSPAADADPLAASSARSATEPAVPAQP